MTEKPPPPHTPPSPRNLNAKPGFRHRRTETSDRNFSEVNRFLSLFAALDPRAL